MTQSAYTYKTLNINRKIENEPFDGKILNIIKTFMVFIKKSLSNLNNQPSYFQFRSTL